MGALCLLAGSLLFAHPAYAAFSASISRSGTVSLAEPGSSTIRPTSTGALGTGSDVVTVTTNCAYGGYKLYVSATSSGGTALKLSDNSDSIPTSSTATGSEAALSRDTWGVGKTASVFSGLQAYNSDAGTLKAFYTGTSSDSYDFYYGVNVSTAKTPGTYTGEVLYTVLMDEACTKYTLNFDGNSATTNTLTPQDLDFDSTIDLAEISSSDKISRTGYALTGWQDQSGNSYGITGTTNVNPNDLASVTLTAEWEANTYLIDYAAGSTGGACSASPTPATYDADVTLSSTKCTKTGYDQDGWSTSDSASNTKAYDLGATLTTPNFTSVADGTYTLYPHFVSTSVSVTVSGGIIGTSGSTTTGTYNPGTSITITANSPSTGYHFTSWSSNNGGSFANASSSQTTFSVPSGVTSVTVTASTAANTYTIAYNANGGSGTTSSQSVTYNGGNVTLRGNSFSRSGYTFKGWSRSSGASNAVHYNASTSYSINTLASNASVTNSNGGTISLYAVWRVTIPDDGSKGNFQTTSICSSIGVGHTATLTDTRDNQKYGVYRWPNTGTAGTSYPTSMAGYCIMTKDLSLGYVTGGSVTKGSNLTLTTSDSAGAGTITARTSGSDWVNDSALLQYANGPGGTYGSHGYYSYAAAQIACPKGWRTPTEAEYSNIATFMGGSNSTGSSKIREEPYSFVYGGGVSNDNSWKVIGWRGLYWGTGTYSYYGCDLFIQSSSLSAGHTGSSRYNGYSVRCIAK